MIWTYSNGGGCCAGSAAAPSCCSTRRSRTALAARHAVQFEDKVAIARRVVDELPEDGVVILDSGSLTFVCAQAMPKDRPLALVTNNLPAAQLPGRATRSCGS